MADLQVAVELVGKDNLSPTITGVQKTMGGVVDGLGKFGLAAMGAQTAISAVGAGISALVGPAMDAQKNAAQLDAVLKSTGGAAGMTAESVGALSTSLSRVTMFEDDAITSAQSLLLTFTNIGQDVFPQATETVLNMSQALGQDLSSSSMQLGKALNDPVKGIGALSRVGVTFTMDQKAMVKEMVNAGDAAGAQAIILAELEKEFGGAAKAAGTTLAGQLQIAQNQLGELQETIGGAIIPVLAELLAALMPVIDSFAEALPGALEALQPMLDFLTEHITSLIIPALVALGAAAVAAAAAAVIAMGPLILTIGAVGLALAGLTALWTTNWGDIQGKAETVWGVLQPIFAALGAALDLFVTVILPALVIAWDQTWTTMQTTLTTVWGVIQTTVETVWPIVESLLLAGLKLVQGDWEAAWEAIRKAFELAWTAIQKLVDTLVQAVLTALRQLADDAMSAARSVGQAIVDGITNAIKDLGNGIRDALLSAVNGALEAAANAVRTFRLPGLPAPTVHLPGHGAGGPEVTGGDIGPSGRTGAALDWAMGRLGASGWAGWCERFVEHAFGTNGRYASAWAAANAMMTNAGGSLAGVPRGALVFFRPDASNGFFGHVGISLGGGHMISATSQGPQITGVNNYWERLYAGWGPPAFANGVRDFGGGMAIVGERGWELAHLPRGTDVYSHGDSQRMLAGAGGGMHVHFHGPVYGFDDFEDRVVQANERATRRGRQ